MNCFYHSDRPAVAQCSVCKKGLCRSCVATLGTIRCKECLEKEKKQLQREINVYKEEEKKQQRKMRILTVVFGVLGVLGGIQLWREKFWEVPLNLYPLAFLFTVYSLAAVPYGWNFLNKYFPPSQRGTSGRTIWILDVDMYCAVGFMQFMLILLKYCIKLWLAMLLGWFFLTKEIIVWLKKRFIN